jgi:hypothetical protein
MKWVFKSIFAGALLVSLPVLANETNGCPEGSYSIVLSPDGSALSLLFDQFTLESGRIAGSEIQRKVCRISSPLNLPANHSIGVYKVDYRGFAKLGAKQQAELDVQYFLGPRDNEHGRVFKRKIKGPKEGDYLFSETIGAGQMKRAGCGTAAMLDVGITLSLDTKQQTGQAMASLDTADAAPVGALVFHLNLKKCP